jgi:hypothetical protein
MSTVGTTIFLDDGIHNYFTLNSGDQYLRTVSIPSSGWATLCVGVLYSIEITSTNSAGFAGGLFVGLVSSAQPNVGAKQGYGALQRAAWGASGLAAAVFGDSVFGQQYIPVSADSAGSTFNLNVTHVYTVSASALSGHGGGSGLLPSPSIENTPRKQVMVTQMYYASSTTIGVKSLMCSDYTGSHKTNYNHTNGTLFSALMTKPTSTDNVIDGVVQSLLGPYFLTFGPTDDTNYPLNTINLFWTGSAACRIYQVGLALPS